MTDQKICIPVPVALKCGWLSWVSCTTASLNSLEVKCDATDVAGMTGYAFHMAIVDGLCPSGPTYFNWGDLGCGIASLGRSYVEYASWECHTGKHINERTTAHCRAVFEIAKSEIKAGRPVVIWGAYIPEFAVVTAIQGDYYIVESFMKYMRPDLLPIKFDELDAPGGPYVLAFPTRTEIPQNTADRRAISSALQFHHRDMYLPNCCFGVRAYDAWINILTNHQAIGFGNSYNAACYAEAKTLGYMFLDRLAGRNTNFATELHQASDLMKACATEMAKLPKIFQFPGTNEPITDDKAISEAITALRAAREHESAAFLILRNLCEIWPEII